MKTEPKITFIGAGNMASSIIGGLIAKGYGAKNITASAPCNDDLTRLKNTFDIHTTSDNVASVTHADVVVLAVKPQIISEVCSPLASDLPSNTLIISVAAGITCNTLGRCLGNKQPIVRCMPNTAALIREGACGLYANNHVSSKHMQLAGDVLSAVGIISWVEDEKLIDTVTALSGSGPAYFFLLLETMIDFAVQQGMEKRAAEALAIQTAFGAASLARESDVGVKELRRRVTSPKGTTEQAIKYLEAKGFSNTMNEALKACENRAKELAKEFDT